MARIIALQACRHGTGCSHLAANLAVILMHHGYRVGVLNTDMQVGGIYTLFGLDESSSKQPETYWWLRADMQSPTSLQAEMRRYDLPQEIESAGIYLSSLGCHWAQGNAHLQGLQQRYNTEKPYEVLQRLSDELLLDFWLIDHQPELTDNDLLGLSLADIALVMLQLDAYDLQRAAVVLEITEQLAIARTWLVPSLVLPTIEVNVVKHMLENTYQYSVAGILYLSEELMGLASRGIFCLHHPEHALTKTMIAIARHLEQDAQALSASSASA